ncbi:alpha/beta hydrolase family protein [Agromyces soli]|uniref:Alpha/beta hydrolase family protein n=1 Tax=Agromyces soli TaxID=659012 RepID=A0ABY4AS23_9MICO|nr:alpha/beta hydrolase family protein [Agromyces soli]UOE25207.1 alpha/beta hydrolase family protein [Agromyces soli]
MTTPAVPLGHRNLSPNAWLLDRARKHTPRFHFDPENTDVEAWREETLAAVLATLGQEPPACEPNPVLLGEIELDGFIQQRWMMDVEDGLSTIVAVNRPSGGTEESTWAPILCWHGHDMGGKEPIMGNRSTALLRSYADDDGYNYGAVMARHGFVTIGVDWMGHGDFDEQRKWRISSPQKGVEMDWCDTYYLNATILGMTPLGINIAHGKRVLDFVTTLPYVQDGPIGVMGVSGGGTMSLWSALADPRIAATEIICYSDTFPDFGVRDSNYCGMQITPGLFSLVDVSDLQGLLFPRALMVDLGFFDDCFMLESAGPCADRVEEIYRRAGASHRFRRQLFAAGHSWCDEQSADFFGEHLR